MPIYEYECRSCKERFEVMQKMSEGNESLHCPSCDADMPNKLISSFCSFGSATGGFPSSGHSSPGHS